MLHVKKSFVWASFVFGKVNPFYIKIDIELGLGFHLKNWTKLDPNLSKPNINIEWVLFYGISGYGFLSELELKWISKNLKFKILTRICTKPDLNI